MNAILIPVDGEPEVVEQDGVADVQRLVGGWLEHVALVGRRDAAAYIDEGGKPGRDHNEAATRFLRRSLREDDYVAGPCVIAGVDPHDGANRPVPEDLLACLVAPGC